jgi:hypothetical protein
MAIRKLKRLVRQAGDRVDERLDGWLRRLQSLKRSMADDQSTFLTLEETAIKHIMANYPDGYRGVTVVGDGTTTSLDQEKLHDLIMKYDPTGRIWNRVTNRTVNTEKLEAAVSSHLVPAKLVKQAMVTKPKKRYINLKSWLDSEENQKARRAPRLQPVCMIPDCGCSGKAHP